MKFCNKRPLIGFSLVRGVISLYRDVAREANLMFVCDVAAGTLLLSQCGSFVIERGFSLLVDVSNGRTRGILEVGPSKRRSFRAICRGIGGLRRRCPSCFRGGIRFGSILGDRSSISSVRSFVFGRFNGVPLVRAVSRATLDSRRGCRRVTGSCGRSPRVVVGEGSESPMCGRLKFFFCCRLSGTCGRCYRMLCKAVGRGGEVPAKAYLPFFGGVFIATSGGLLAYREVDLRRILNAMSGRMRLGFKRVTDVCGSCCRGVESRYQKYCLVRGYNRYFLRFPLGGKMPMYRMGVGRVRCRRCLSRVFKILRGGPDLFRRIGGVIFT